MLARFVNFFKGTVSVRLISSQCEQILNVLHRKGINFWKLKRVDEQSISFRIFEKELSVFNMICNRYHADVELFYHRSFNIAFKKYGKRWGVLIGAVTMVALMGILSCFIWDVKVLGCDEKTTESEVLRQFEELGLGVGKRRYGLNISDIENRFVLNNDDVFWVSVNMRFTTAYIELREKMGKEMEIYDLTSPCDIYAARDGQIVSMITTSGTPLVKVGDSVCAGDKLVSREYIDRYGKSIIVHSIATINAKTKRIIKSETALTECIHTPTGKSKSFFSLNLFNFKIPLYFKEKISYNNYDITEGKYVIKIGNFALPIALKRKTYTEVEILNAEVEYEQAKIIALAKLLKQEKEQLFEVEIINKTIKEETVNGNLVLIAEYECIEDIAYTVGD